MQLICYETSIDRVELRPASRRRTWMEGTPALHCTPLVIANAHGWEMLCPFAVEIEWTGGETIGDLDVRYDRTEDAKRPEMVASHFGSGILSFHPSVVLRTPPGVNLWVTGPTNAPKDGIQPLSASIETDWMPSVFSMNWKMTRPHHTVRFEKGEPFCMFFPITRGLVTRAEPRIAAVTEDPAIRDQVEWATARRNLDSFLAEREKDVYQKWYQNGEFPRPSAGSAPRDHEVSISPKPFGR